MPANESDFNAVFARLIQLRAGGLVIGADNLFVSRSEQLSALALRHAVPTIYQSRDLAVAGGLLGYGTDFRETYRLAGNYTGRVLKGEKPADLPVHKMSYEEYCRTKICITTNYNYVSCMPTCMQKCMIYRADRQAKSEKPH